MDRNPIESRNRESIPTISRVFEDGTLIDLVYDRVAGTTALAVARPDGTFGLEPEYQSPTGEQLIPYSARNNLIASECVLLPSDIGDVGDNGDLVGAVSDFLHRYVDLSPAFEEIAAYYVILTWVYDAFNDLPYLRLRGDYGTGKTRALLALGSLCYKAFFASGASTVSPIFHIQDAFQGTLILDEADFRFSDATAELTKVLNNGTTRGLPVLRTMTNRNRELNPTAFRVFGPKIIAMREDFSDKALESRFFTEETGARELRADIPIHLPGSFKGEALALRNRLLAWRFKTRRSVGSDPARLISDIEPRTNQMALSLLSIVADEGARARIGEALRHENERARADRADCLESTMMRAVVAARADSATGAISVASVASAFNRKSAFGTPMSNRWVGGFLRSRLRLETMKSRGVYVVPATEGPKVDALAARYAPDIGASDTPVLSSHVAANGHSTGAGAFSSRA
jgi:hypothetical protein